MNGSDVIIYAILLILLFGILPHYDQTTNSFLLSEI